EQAHPEPHALAAVLERAPGEQVADETVRRRLGHARSACEFADAQLVVVHAEEAEKPETARQGGERVLTTGTAHSLPLCSLSSSTAWTVERKPGGRRRQRKRKRCPRRCSSARADGRG